MSPEPAVVDTSFEYAGFQAFDHIDTSLDNICSRTKLMTKFMIIEPRDVQVLLSYTSHFELG